MTSKAVRRLVDKIIGASYCPVWFHYRKVDYNTSNCSREDFFCCFYCDKECRMRCGNPSASHQDYGHGCRYTLSSLEYAYRRLKKRHGYSFVEFLSYAQKYMGEGK